MILQTILGLILIGIAVYLMNYKKRNDECDYESKQGCQALKCITVRKKCSCKDKNGTPRYDIRD